MGRHKRNKKNGAREGDTGRYFPWSDVPTGWGIRGEHCRISRLTRTVWAFYLLCDHWWSGNHSLITFSLSWFSSPIWPSDITLSAHSSVSKGGSGIEPTAQVCMDGVHCHRHVQWDWRPHWSSCPGAGTNCPFLQQMILRWRALLWGGMRCCFPIIRRCYLDRKAHSSGGNCPYYSRGSQGSGASCFWEPWRD